MLSGEFVVKQKISSSQNVGLKRFYIKRGKIYLLQQYRLLFVGHFGLNVFQFQKDKDQTN